MKRVIATSTYVRSWLPSLWKRALQRLLHFLLRLAMLPRKLLLANGAAADTSSSDNRSLRRRRWLQMGDGDAVERVTLIDGPDGEDDAFFRSLDAETSRRVGLLNTGNTCFVNAVVQCLLAIPGFVDCLDEELQRVMGDADGGQETEEKEEEEGTKKQTHEQEKDTRHLQLAIALLDLLKGLVLEEQESRVTQEQEPQATAATEGAVGSESADVEAATASDQVAAQENGNGHHDAPVRIPPQAGKKRKRPLAMTMAIDKSPAATTKRLRCFLQAASKCSDLVSAETRRQDQQDAEELLLFLLDSLHELVRSPSSHPPPLYSADDATASATKTARLVELNRLVDLETECLQYLKKCVVTDPDTYNRTVCFLSDVRWRRYLMENRSFITAMFTGQTVRGSQCCSCANLTCLHQEFRVLSLSIDPSKPSQTIDDCLATHRRLEDLVADNQVFCDGHCKAKTNRRTQVLIQRAPQTLVIQLQRFKHTTWRASAEKIATSVQFPIDEPLDLTLNMFMRDVAQPVQYELQAVCAHIGSALDAGHYIAYARGISPSPFVSDDAAGEPRQQRKPSTSGRWTKFDDDFVTTLDDETLRRETRTTAYMLFYSQVAAAPQPHRKTPQEEEEEEVPTIGNHTTVAKENLDNDNT